ncbi:MAG: hypothetical protein Q8O23_02125 [Gallionella sp.]|nr:hypothetical protein [Gallionella sp.]
MNTIIEYGLFAYLAIGMAKSMLVLADVHVAAGTVHRLDDRPVWLLMLGFAIGVLVTSLLLWPRALAAEGWRFFLAYSRFGVIRQVLEAYREADIRQTEAASILKGDPHAHE